jgi:hypothetical protein
VRTAGTIAIFFVVVAGGNLAWFLVMHRRGFRMLQKAPPAPPHQFVSGGFQSFLASARLGFWSVPVRGYVDAHRLALKAPLGLTRVDIERSEVTAVSKAGVLIGWFYFASRDGRYDGVLLRYSRYRWDLLSGYGWPVHG